MVALAEALLAVTSDKQMTSSLQSSRSSNEWLLFVIELLLLLMLMMIVLESDIKLSLYTRSLPIHGQSRVRS